MLVMTSYRHQFVHRVMDPVSPGKRPRDGARPRGLSTLFPQVTHRAAVPFAQATHRFSTVNAEPIGGCSRSRPPDPATRMPCCSASGPPAERYVPLVWSICRFVATTGRVVGKSHQVQVRDWPPCAAGRFPDPGGFLDTGGGHGEVTDVPEIRVDLKLRFPQWM